MTEAWIAHWTQGSDLSPSLITLKWALLLAAAALAGHLVQRLLGLPKLVGYAVFGTLAGLTGLASADWPLRGAGLTLLELGIAVLLFEAGARLSLRWLRHNPMVLAQSAVESLLTYAVAYLLLRALGLELAVVRALSVVAVASSPAVLLRAVSDLRASGPVTDRAIALATLNTLYALTLGTAMLRSIDRGDVTLLASLGASAVVLGISLLVGGALAALLRLAFRLLHPASQDTAIVILALIAACVALTTPLGGSAPLAALLAGIVLKQLHPRPWVWPRQLGTAASMLSIAMFVLVSSMAAQAAWSGAMALAALGLTGARLLAKLASLLLTGPVSALSLRQSAWVGVAMFPMSAVALLLTSQFVAAAPTVGTSVTAIALPVILLTELLGAALVGLALVRAHEAAPPRRWREPPPTEADAQETRP
ncbi:MAG: cation:proton antiporter [Proteobacteria bacterium]|nr:cation:proton antiporter [Pseudomonadota bacterium]